MQRDRIDPAHPCAATLPKPRTCAQDARVVGLGAPLSVRIRLEPCERAALRHQILKQVPAISQPHPATSDNLLEHVDDAAQAQAWREMLAQLDDHAEHTPVVVLWPTALATPALRGALNDALAAVADRAYADDGHAALAHALMTAATLLETLRALLAVDHGGLSEVDL
ncbi:MAG TPA: hypothetical protein VI300_01165 [Solirubrobacter sp.]